VVRPEPRPPAIPEPENPTPPAWEVELARFRSDLETLIDSRDRSDYEAFDTVGARLNRERPRYVGKGEAAKSAFNRLEDEIRSKIERIVRGDLNARLSRLKKETRTRLSGPLEAKAFAAIQKELDGVDDRIRDLPNILVIDFAAEFAAEVDEIKEYGRARAEEITRRMLREAGNLAQKYRFISAEKKLDSLVALEVEIFYPKVRPEVETLRGKIEALRTSAKEVYEESYQAFRIGLGSRLSSWQYQQAEMELTEFEARVKAWQREAPKESWHAAGETVNDRSDFLGVMGIWKLAIQRLETLSRLGKEAPDRLSFGKESSAKEIVELEGERYPEVIWVRYRVGGKVLRRKLTLLAPEDVIALAARAGVLEERWVALFYFFAAQHPDHQLAMARRLLGHAKVAFAKAGGAGPRYGPLIQEFERILNANAKEHERMALRLHQEALAHFNNWEFKQAHTAWATMQMQSRFRAVFKQDAKYEEFLKLAQRSEPLEALKRRFPGAKREHLYRQWGKPLAFRLTFQFGKNMDLTGLDFAREQWQPSPEGLVRIEQENIAVEGNAFPTTWGIKVPVQLNYDLKAVLSIKVKTAEDRVMSLLGMSLGGNIAGLLNLDGVEPDLRGERAPRTNQLSLWTSPARPRYPGFDAFQDYADHFQLASNNRQPGVEYRLRLGADHDLTLTVDGKEERLVFRADGAIRAHKSVKKQVRSFGEIEIRAWNKPVVLKELTIEGVLGK